MSGRTYGHTRSGEPITDELIERLADEAERGYDVDRLIERRGKREPWQPRSSVRGPAPD